MLLAESEKDDIAGAGFHDLFVCLFYFGNSNPTPRPELFFVKHSSNSGCLAIKRDKSSEGWKKNPLALTSRP